MRSTEELRRLTKVKVVRIECPDLSKKSRFHDLYRDGIMRTLGQDFCMKLIEDAVHAVGLSRREDMISKLKAKFDDEEVAKASIRIIDPNFDTLRLWRWISGVALSRGDLDDLTQTQDLTTAESARLADIICMFGRLLKELHGETLVLILDEMERLKSIGNETIGTFISGFTRLSDPNQTSVSILIGASARQLETDMIEVFNNKSPVTSRLGPDALLEIPALEDADVSKFIKKVIQYVRDPAMDVKELVKKAKGTVDEDVTADFFPFTEVAIDTLKSRLTDVMTPREITMKMTRAMGRAFRLKKRAITSDCFK
jgi:hypothetical protein